MTARSKNIQKQSQLTELVTSDNDLIKKIVEIVLNEMLEAEMDQSIGASRYERTAERLTYRSGYYQRSLITRVGKIVLRVPRDRQGIFSSEIFERYQRSEKALTLAIAEMYVQGVSTRKVTEIAEELLGEQISAATVSRLNKSLDANLSAFFNRRLQGAYPYVFVDARYNKVREEGIVRSRAVMVAIGVNAEGTREILAIDLARKESGYTWRDFFISLKERGLTGVEMMISDAHEGLKNAIAEIFPEALWQRCYVHTLRNAMDYVDKKKDTEVLTELRWVYERANVNEAIKDITAWIARWEATYPKLVAWVETNIYESLTFYKFPPAHRKHIKSTNMVERLNQEIKRRTLVVRIFPNRESALRLIRALGVEIHEDWLEENRYLNIEELKEYSRFSVQERAS